MLTHVPPPAASAEAPLRVLLFDSWYDENCNPMCWRLQPHVLEAATPCAGGCNPMCARLPEDALEQEGVGTVHVSQPQHLDG